AVGTDNFASFVDAKQVAQSKIGAWIEIFIIERGLKAGHDRSTGVDVFTNLLALLIAQHGDVRQYQRTIFTETIGIETIFMHTVKRETALKQRVVQALSRLMHVGVSVRSSRAGIKMLRALAHDNANVGDGAACGQVGTVPCGPAKIIRADCLPATIF